MPFFQRPNTRRISSRYALIIIFVITTLACSISSRQPTGTPTPDSAATQAVQQAQEATQAVIDKATFEAKQTVDAEAKRSTAVFQKTQAAEKRATQKVASAQTATANVVMSSTEQASDFASVIEQLYEDRVITSDQGNYYQVEDFDESWAQINWYQWWSTGLNLTNFVIRVDASWESASEIANFFSSGCGFVYSGSDENNHYATFLALDGRVHTYRMKHGIGTEMTGGYYGPLDTPEGNARILLAVDHHVVTVYVNEKKVVRFEDNSLGEGDLALTLFSGTNKDFGTRCVMQNIEVWELP
jgi:hypothetical protein